MAERRGQGQLQIWIRCDGIISRPRNWVGGLAGRANAQTSSLLISADALCALWWYRGGFGSLTGLPPMLSTLFGQDWHESPNDPGNHDNPPRNEPNPGYFPGKGLLLDMSRALMTLKKSILRQPGGYTARFRGFGTLYAP